MSSPGRLERGETQFSRITTLNFKKRQMDIGASNHIPSTSSTGPPAIIGLSSGPNVSRRLWYVIESHWDMSLLVKTTDLNCLAALQYGQSAALCQQAVLSECNAGDEGGNKERTIFQPRGYSQGARPACHTSSTSPPVA